MLSTARSRGLCPQRTLEKDDLHDYTFQCPSQNNSDQNNIINNSGF